MRKAAGIVLGVLGLVMLTFSIAALVWAHHQYTIGVSERGAATLVGMGILGAACIIITGYRLAARSTSH